MVVFEPLPLITASVSIDEHHLIIGTHSCPQSIKKIKTTIAAGATPILINPSHESHIKEISSIFLNESGFQLATRGFQLSDLTTLGRTQVQRVVDRVFINLSPEETPLTRKIYEQCVKLRIPVNAFQRPEYSTFHMIPTFTDPKGSGLQIAVTTNGRGYILANRIKREIVNKLPSNISQVVTNMGAIRDQIIHEDHEILLREKYLKTELSRDKLGYGLDDDTWESHKFNRLIKEFEMTNAEQKLKRTRWLSQIMEYYPLNQLANVTLDQLDENSHTPINLPSPNNPDNHENSQSINPETPANTENNSEVQLGVHLRSVSYTHLDVYKRQIQYC